MSSLIEKAALRLEQLRQAGADIPATATPEIPTAPSGVKSSQTPEAFKPVSKAVRLDLARLADAGFVTPNAPRSEIADQYRVIKRPLIANAT
ncbi:MAG: chromosome partitioning ATPase, partial [Hydrogenophaga sp.]|nr:chromosome partitioning ATPase [Hydrogenophaga sp.]